MVVETTKSMKFGSGQRSKMELKNAKFVPGPGQHSPDFKKVYE